MRDGIQTIRASGLVNSLEVSVNVGVNVKSAISFEVLSGNRPLKKEGEMQKIPVHTQISVKEVVLEKTRKSQFWWGVLLLVATLLWWNPAFGQPHASEAADTPGRLNDLVAQRYSHLETLYRHFHSHPELFFQERETAGRLAEELKGIGFEVFTGIGGYGVVGILKNGKGPTVMIRTDMDALPITEESGLPYASSVRTKDREGRDVGIMHACGHDVHMTVFVGTAWILVQLRELWAGTLMMVGQPAEEKGAGAKAMLADGLFEAVPNTISFPMTRI